MIWWFLYHILMMVSSKLKIYCRKKRKMNACKIATQNSYANITIGMMMGYCSRDCVASTRRPNKIIPTNILPNNLNVNDIILPNSPINSIIPINNHSTISNIFGIIIYRLSTFVQFPYHCEADIYSKMKSMYIKSIYSTTQNRCTCKNCIEINIGRDRSKNMMSCGSHKDYHIS